VDRIAVQHSRPGWGGGSFRRPSGTPIVWRVGYPAMNRWATFTASLAGRETRRGDEAGTPDAAGAPDRDQPSLRDSDRVARRVPSDESLGYIHGVPGGTRDCLRWPGCRTTGSSSTPGATSASRPSWRGVSSAFSADRRRSNDQRLHRARRLAARCTHGCTRLRPGTARGDHGCTRLRPARGEGL
jgi:hypothetical protein